MRIVCDSCGAKYSIADEKVAGKVFRIRCKKCNAAIVVRGDGSASVAPAENASAKSAAPDPQQVWHVVIQGEQKGPYTPKEVEHLITTQQLDGDSYIWKEGFDNWKFIKDLPEFAKFLSRATVQPEPENKASASDPPNFGDEESTSIAATPFGSEGVNFNFPAAAGVAAGAAAKIKPVAQKSADLFAPENENRASVTPSQPPVMTGARNESSLLFSLSNLKDMASKSSPPPGLSGSGGLGGGTSSSTLGGSLTTEGSGLIDIRALASAAASQKGAQEQARSIEDILSIGTSAGTFGSPIGAPILAPERPERNTLMMVALGVLGLALVVMGVALFVVFGRKDEPAVAIQTPAANPAPSAAAPAAPQAPTATAETRPSTAEKHSEDRAAQRDDKEKVARSEQSSSRSNGHSKSSSRGESRSRQEEVPSAPASKGKGGSDIDSLLDRALSGGGGGAASKGGNDEPSGGDDLPETPSRDQVLSALKAIQPQVQACGNGGGGVANTAITVMGSTGRVTSATVSGQYAGTPVGSCVAKTVRNAKFPRFKRSTFQINFPYSM